MTYLAGVAGASPALSAVNQLEGLLDQNGYVLVDTWNPSSTIVYRVWRNPATNNQAGIDWYLVLGRSQDTSTTVTFQLGEAYDASTHVLSKAAPAQSTASKTLDADTASTGSAAINAITTPHLRISLAVGTVNTFIAFSVSRHRVFIGSRASMNYTANNAAVQAASAYVYAGCFDSLLPPLMSTNPAARDTGLLLAGHFFGTAATNNQYLAGSSTREPGLSQGGTTTGAAYWTVTAAPGSITWVTPNTSDTELYSNRRIGGRIMLWGRTTLANTTFTSANGGLRGLLKDVMIYNLFSGGGALVGDDVSFTAADGSTGTYVLMTQGTTYQYWADRNA